MKIRTFKLIDKIGYLSTGTRKSEKLEKYFTSDGTVTVRIEDSVGWVGYTLVISDNDWKYFEESGIH